MFGQRSFDELGTPLCDTTFCVVDLETTGVSLADCAITEIGAVKYRGGEKLGEFQVLINPGLPIPPAIVMLTGITDLMVAPAPSIGEMLPTFLEFCEGSVLVGHNFRFDLSFLNAALADAGHDRLRHPTVCTAALARRLVRDDVHDCTLHTLARHFRCPHQPSHRALADALATADLLHGLLELAGRLGVLGLGDLLELPRARGQAHYAKIGLTKEAPRRPGVYRFADRDGQVLYVGKARDLRARVRSYFYGDSRKKVAGLLRETASLEWTVTTTELEAEVHEVREIAGRRPRYNSRSRNPGKGAYLAVTIDEPWPRLSVVRSARNDGRLYLGPLTSARQARDLEEALLSAVPLRRCGGRLPAVVRSMRSPCASAQLGCCLCPCSGLTGAREYSAAVDRLKAGLLSDPALLLGPLEERMWALAGAERYEEAAIARDRVAALSGGLRRHHRLSALAAVPRLVVETLDGEGAAIAHGRLVASWVGPTPLLRWPDEPAPLGGVVALEHADEVATVAAWLDRHADRLRVVEADGPLAFATAAGVLSAHGYRPRAAVV